MKVYLRINDRCTLACRYCFEERRKQHGGELSKKVADDILEFCRRHNVKSVEIPQREPTASDDVLRYVLRRFPKGGVEVTGVVTNAYRLPKWLLRTLRRRRISVLASYDGLWHDDFRLDVRGRPTAETVRENVRRLVESGVPTTVACTVVHGVCHMIYENWRHLSSLTRSVAFNFDVTSPFAITRKDVLIIRGEFAKIARAGGEPFPLNKIKRRLLSGARYTNFMCGAGRGAVCVNYDGRIYPCYHVSAWEAMGVCLGDVWSGIDEEKLRRFQEYDTATPEKCRSCGTALCGICYTASWEVVGDPLTPIPINCLLLKSLTKVVKEHLGVHHDLRRVQFCKMAQRQS